MACTHNHGKPHDSPAAIMRRDASWRHNNQAQLSTSFQRGQHIHAEVRLVSHNMKAAGSLQAS